MGFVLLKVPKDVKPAPAVSTSKVVPRPVHPASNMEKLNSKESST